MVRWVRLPQQKEGGMGLVCIENGIDASIQWLKDYIKESKEGLIVEADNNTNNIRINRTITKT